VKLVCISDTHGDHESVVLPNGDVLIHAGDVTGHGTEVETLAFFQWLGRQPIEHKVCIAGNHDTYMEEDPIATAQMAEDCGVVLLNDSKFKINDVLFWGSPITPRFMDWSFMRDPGADIEKHWNQIPNDTDVLITHGPAQGILDVVERQGGEKEHTGCPSLLRRIEDVKPQYHLFGHIHEGYGAVHKNGVSYFNISTMNKGYRIQNDAVVLEVGES